MHYAQLLEASQRRITSFLETVSSLASFVKRAGGTPAAAVWLLAGSPHSAYRPLKAFLEQDPGPAPTH